MSAAVAIDVASPVAYVEMGIPFTAIGRIAAEDAPPVRYNSGNAPITANGRLSMSGDAVVRYASGIPYTATGAIAAEGVAPFLGVRITQQPGNITVTDGDPAVFMVVAISGDMSPLLYQWQQLILAVWTDLVDGGAISGALTDTLTINPAALVDTGAQFRCIVDNDVDSQTSDPATLTVDAVATFYVLTEAGDRVLTEASDFVLTEAA